MEPIEVLLRAVDQTGRIVAGVNPGDELGVPTPCGEWDLRTLLNHTVGVLKVIENGARGREFSPASGDDNIGADPAAAYRAEVVQVRDALSDSGVMDHVWHMPFGSVPAAMAVGFMTLEINQHGWDVARATGQAPDWDPEVTETAFAVARMAPAEALRSPGVFGPEQECPPDLPPADRLAAFLGRTP